MTDRPTDFQELNLEKVCTAAKDYAIATGIECLVLSGDGKTIHNPCEGRFHRRLCYRMDKNIGKYCLATHYEGALNALDPNAPSVYYCPMGLAHWASPIVVSGKLAAAFIGGHSFLNHSGDLAGLKHLTAEHAELLHRFPELERTLGESPVVSEERQSCLRNLLHTLAGSFSDGSDASLLPDNLTEAFRRFGGEDSDSEESWASLPSRYESMDEEAKAVEVNAVAEKLLRMDELDAGKAALGRMVLMIYDHSLERNGQCFLVHRCLHALAELEKMNDSSELIRWIHHSLPQLLEAGTIVAEVKSADMIHSAIRYIQEHYSDKITLQAVADHVHFSAPYFSKVFKKEMDITFTKYVTQYRIEKSKELLKDTRLPLSDIPGMVGFEEQSYFTRVFRSIVGISPGKYRTAEALRARETLNG